MGLRDLFRRGGGGTSAGAGLPGGRGGRGGPVDPAALIDQLQQLRRLGRLEDARQQLATALAAGPSPGAPALVDHPDLNRLYWDLCVQLERPEAAAAEMLRAIRGQLRDGRGDDAAFAWFELSDRLAEPPAIDLDLRRRLAEAMLAAGHGEAAAELLEASADAVDAATPLPTLLRLALAAAASRSPSAPALVEGALARSGVPESQRQALEAALAEARTAGLHPRSDEVADDAPIEVAATTVSDRRLKVAAAVPRAVDGERLTLAFAGGAERGLALRQVQAVATARIEEGAEPDVLIDLFLDSLWSDEKELRVVRLRTRDFSPSTLVPGAADEQLALATLLATLLDASGAQPLPDAEAARGRPFHAFASVAEYRRRVLEIE